MRLIDADALIEFCEERWIPLNIDAVNMQPTIQPEKEQLSCEGTTFDTISRQTAIDTVDSEVVSTNPEHFKSSEKFIKFMDDADIASFGKWQWANGFNTALVASKVKLEKLPTSQPEPQWISVTERLPDNADHPGAFCPRYQVVTPYGVTEGWYRPHDHEKGGQWFALFWFMSQIYEIWNIDFERGDVPKVIGEAPVMEWRPLPEPYKPNK